MSSVIISKELNYMSGKVQSSLCSRQRLRIQPHNASEFNVLQSVQMAQININTGQMGTFLSTQQAPYLKLQVEVAVGATALTGALNLKYNASSLINRLIVRHGSDILQDTQDYNKVACLLTDIQGTASMNGIVQGYSASRLGTELAPVTANTTTTREFILPLMGVLSASTLKALPIGQMKNAPLTLELYFEKLITAGTITAEADRVSSFRIRNVELFGEQLTFSPEIASVLEKQTGGKYLINTQSIQSFRNNVPQGTTQATQIPIKCSYLKSLLCAYYLNASVDTAIASRANPFAGNGVGWFHWMIGGTQMPQQNVNIRGDGNGCEAQVELVKALKDFSPFEENLLGNSTTFMNQTAGSFAVGIDLERYAVNSDAMLQGMDVFSVDTFLNASFGTAERGAYTLLTTAIYDSVISVENGRASLVY